MKKYLFIISVFFLNFSLVWSQSKIGVSINSKKFFSENSITHKEFVSDTLIMNGIAIDTMFFKKFVFPLLDLKGRDLKVEPFFFDENIFDSPTSKGYFHPIDNILIYKPKLISPMPTWKPDSTINFTLIIKDFK
jgi:hypothetical protein